MKRWLAWLCLTGLLIALMAIGLPLSVASDDILYGDTDGDGSVSMKDVLSVRRYIAHRGELGNPLAADVNGDASVDMRDVLLLRKYIAYLIDSFPAAPAEAALPDLSSKVPFFRYGYDQLSSLEKAAYTETVDAVEANLEEDTAARDGRNGLTVVFTDPLPNETSVAHVFRALYTDHPEFYFLSSDYSYSRTPDGIVTALLLHYHMTAAERALAGPQLIQTVNEWIADLPADASDTDKEIALHDRLCQTCTYTDGDGLYPDVCYSPYGALIQKSAVCDGYARALQLLCLAAKIKSTVVEGFTSSGAAHMWNVVYLAGEPYYVDPTWDDTQALTSHAYCNITTADIAKSHPMNFFFPIPPSCTATSDNYYRRVGHYVTTSDGEDFARLLLDARQRGETGLDVRFAPNVMAANRQMTESGHLVSVFNDLAPADVKPLTGYIYSFFDSVNVVNITF